MTPPLITPRTAWATAVDAFIGNQLDDACTDAVERVFDGDTAGYLEAVRRQLLPLAEEQSEWQLRIRIGLDPFLHFLDDGRLRTQFDLGLGGLDGNWRNYYRYRSQLEAAMFDGYSADEMVGAPRPLYAYVDYVDEVVEEATAQHALRRYRGDAVMILEKSTVLHNATLTWGDSFRVAHPDPFASRPPAFLDAPPGPVSQVGPSRLDDLHWRSAPFHLGDPLNEIDREAVDEHDAALRMPECQIHAEVTPDDVILLVVLPRNEDKHQKFAEAAGQADIPVELATWEDDDE